MTLRNARGEAPAVAVERGWLDISWTGRSLVAAAFLSVCMLLTALSATASVRRADAMREAQAALAGQAALVAEFRTYLAEQNARAPKAFNGPRLKPARSTEDVVAEHGAVADLVDFDFDELRIAQNAAKERNCLAQAIYYEARSEPRIGQLAVADVVLNRVASPLFPNTICGVVFQGADRKTGCQFTFTCDGAMKMAINRRKWAQAQDLAGAILAGLREPVSRHATHYHATYVSPPWSKTLTPTAVIGSHKFYRFPSRTRLAAAEPSAAK
ncbi:MAG: cell wall hydrolase [Alphaproteobacteria bacterium]|nr:cell wall hydrolase [Alphaproteobacteria bacterium]